MRTTKMRVVVTGATGRLGATLAQELVIAGHAVSALSRSALDVSDADAVKAVIGQLRPDAIVNCSAYNAVDAAEADPGSAFAVNTRGPAVLADAAAAAGALLVHYSTDFVFDGRATEPYTEDAATNPLNVYGASKLAGEQEVRRLGQHYVIRVASLFGGRAAGPSATVDFIARTLAAGLPVRALVDRSVTPSYVSDVVRVTRTLIQQAAPYGTYHCVASGTTTWYELALEIAGYLNVPPTRVVPVPCSEFLSAAPRPRHCALSNRKLIVFGLDMPTWRATIVRHLRTCRNARRERTLQVRSA